MSTALPVRPPLRRDPADGVVAGVCAGIGRWLAIDPLLVRIALVVTTVAGGLGLLVYAAAWILVPAAEGRRPGLRTRRPAVASLQVGAGATLLLVAGLLTLREVGLWAGDAVAFPLVLAVGGVALVWRQGTLRPSAPVERAIPRPALEVPTPAPEPSVATDGRRADRAAGLSRGSFGVLLILGAGLLVLQTTGALSGARDVVLSVVVVATALGLILAPFLLRLGRSLTAERAARIRSQERAEVAAHLHDSVLQTLALVQKQAHDPRAVAQLARRQERELRGWLDGVAFDAADATFAAALRAAAADVEERFGAPVEVVLVGDTQLDEAAEAVVAAAREAMVNAAKFAGADLDAPIRLFGEAGDDALEVFVRDRGPGYDPAAVPADRRGVRESIVGRLARHGGRATVRTAPGEGVEVELHLGRRR